MKSLRFDNCRLAKNEDLWTRLSYKLHNIEVIQDTLLLGPCEVHTDQFRDDNYLRELDNIEDIVAFVMVFVSSVLKDNAMAERRKAAPYQAMVRAQISFEHKVCQLHFYVDNAVFGVVVGSKFGNVMALVAACFPIMAKLPHEVEIRFFPACEN